MFTGIITHLGRIEAIELSKKTDLLLQISVNKNQIRTCSKSCCDELDSVVGENRSGGVSGHTLSSGSTADYAKRPSQLDDFGPVLGKTLQIGCSIACNGICLTLVKKKISVEKIIFSFQASEETVAKTTLKNWSIGQIINLEFALRMGDELGGHLVSGHVDGIAEIKAIEQVKDSQKFTFAAPKNLMKFIAEKGSATLDGVSLTVNWVGKDLFSINLINHSLKNTNFKTAKVGDFVNLEIDLIARYLARFEQA